MLGTLAVLFSAGCDHPHDTNQEPLPETGIAYSSKNGLLVSPETAKFIGLETAEVSERPLRATREVTAQIFRAANTGETHALASALMSAAEASLLQPGLISVATPTSPAAELLRLDRSDEPQTGMVEAILRVDDPALTFSDGGRVTARFPVGSTNAVTVVPNAALVHTLTGSFVYLENGAHLTRALVKPGRTDGEFTEITDGVLAGDRVVTRSVMTLWMTELHNINGGDACCIRPESKK